MIIKAIASHYYMYTYLPGGERIFADENQTDHDQACNDKHDHKGTKLRVQVAFRCFGWLVVCSVSHMTVVCVR